MFIVRVFSNGGLENLIFVKIFVWVMFLLLIVVGVGPLWQLEHELRVDFTMFMHFIIYRVLVCMLGV